MILYSIQYAYTLYILEVNFPMKLQSCTPLCDTSLLDDTPLCDTPDDMFPEMPANLDFVTCPIDAIHGTVVKFMLVYIILV